MNLSVRDQITLCADKDQVRKILVNLVSNALKFTHRGGSIEVSVGYEEMHQATIIVTDTGRGSRKKTCRVSLIAIIRLPPPGRCSRVGAGSAFTLILPEARVTDPSDAGSETLYHYQGSTVLPVAPKPSTGAVITNGQEGKPVILLVEDNPDMRQYLVGLISDRYHVAEAGDGVEALDYLQTHRADLVISDVMMPWTAFSFLKNSKSSQRSLTCR